MRFDERKAAEYHAKREALGRRRAEAWQWARTNAPHFAGTVAALQQAFGKVTVKELYDQDGKLIFKNEL